MLLFAWQEHYIKTMLRGGMLPMWKCCQYQLGVGYFAYTQARMPCEFPFQGCPHGVGYDKLFMGLLWCVLDLHWNAKSCAVTRSGDHPMSTLFL